MSPQLFPQFPSVGEPAAADIGRHDVRPLSAPGAFRGCADARADPLGGGVVEYPARHQRVDIGRDRPLVADRDLAAGDGARTLVVAGAGGTGFRTILRAVGPGEGRHRRGAGAVHGPRRVDRRGAARARVGIARRVRAVRRGPAENARQVRVLAELPVRGRAGGGRPVAAGGDDLQRRVHAVDDADIGIVGIGASRPDGAVAAEIQRELRKVGRVRIVGPGPAAAIVAGRGAIDPLGEEHVAGHGGGAEPVLAAMAELRQILDRFARLHPVGTLGGHARRAREGYALALHRRDEDQLRVCQAGDVHAEIGAVRRVGRRGLSQDEVQIDRIRRRVRHREVGRQAVQMIGLRRGPAGKQQAGRRHTEEGRANASLAGGDGTYSNCILHEDLPWGSF